MPIWVIQLLIRITATILSATVALVAIYGIGVTAFRIPPLARLEVQLMVYLFFVDWATITFVPIMGYALACSFTRKPRFPALILFACLHATLLPWSFRFMVDNSDHIEKALSIIYYFFCLIVFPPMVSAIITEVVTGILFFLKKIPLPSHP